MNTTAKTSAGAKRPSVLISTTEEDFRRHVDEYDGVCLACGEWTYGGVEPDARGYACDGCGMRLVVGAEEALLMGRLIIT